MIGILVYYVRVCLCVPDDDDESVAFIDVFCIGWSTENNRLGETMLHNTQTHTNRHFQAYTYDKLIDFSLCSNHICINFAFLIEEDWTVWFVFYRDVDCEVLFF